MPSSALPISIYCGRIPLNPTYSPVGFFKAFLGRLRISLPDTGGASGNVLTGFAGVSSPSSNVGPWFQTGAGPSGASWRAWDQTTGQYTVVDQRIGSGIFTSVLVKETSTTVFRTIKVPNASGTLLMLLDVYVPRATVVLPDPGQTPPGNAAATPNIQATSTSDPYDGHSSNTYIQRLTSNTVYTFSNFNDGQKITLRLENTGTTYAASFTSPTPKWVATPPHTMPAGSTGINAVGLFTFRKINGAAYGELLNQTPGQPTATVDLGGTAHVAPGYIPPSETRKQPY